MFSVVILEFPIFSFFFPTATKLTNGFLVESWHVSKGDVEKLRSRDDGVRNYPVDMTIALRRDYIKRTYLEKK